MKHITLLLLWLSAFGATAAADDTTARSVQSADSLANVLRHMETEAEKMVGWLVDKHVDYNKIYDACDFVHPAADKEYMRRLMRFVKKLTARHPYVKTEEGIELMELVARFAGNSVFTDTLAPSYQHDCDVYFAQWKQHPAVRWMHDQLPVYGISYDAVPWMGAHLVWTENGFETIPNDDKTYKRWTKKAVREFRPYSPTSTGRATSPSSTAAMSRHTPKP